MHWRIRPAVAVITLTVLAVVTTAVFTAALLWELRGKELAHARGATASLSRILAEQTTRSIQNADLVMQKAQTDLAEFAARGKPPTGEAAHKMLRDRVSGMPQIRNLFVVAADGRVMSNSRSFPGKSVSVADRRYFVEQRDDPRRGLFIGTPLRGRVSGIWTLHLSRRVAGRRGEFGGVIAVALDLEYLERLYQSISFDGIAPISLHLADGTVIARQPHDEAAIGNRTAATANLRFGETGQSTQEEAQANGDKRIVTYSAVSQFPLMVGVAIGEERALANWRETSRFVILGAAGVIVLLLLAAQALVLDLRKQDALARDLLESGERLRETMKAAMDAIIIADADQRIILFNPAAERMFGCAAADAVGVRLERFLPERYRATHPRHVENFGAAAGGSRVMASSREVTGLRADGVEFPIEATVSRVTLNGEALYTAILRDITERRQADQQLLESNSQLRELSATLQDVREKERTRIARELHDELGQQLTGLRMELSWLGNQLSEKRDALTHKVEGMKQQIDVTIKSVRRIATELRPTLLDDLGLGAAIEWLAADFLAKTGIAVDLDLTGAGSAKGDALATALFRITQECLTNVARHAAATRLSISLRVDGDVLELAVADNGKGMAADAAAKRGSHGLIGIRERAIMLGAKATFVISPGAGTAVRVAIPLDRQTKTELET